MRYINGHQSRGKNRGASNGRYKGGAVYNKVHDRFMVNRGDGIFTCRARKVMEEHLGRKLERDEVVHHINGDKHDDRIENLVVMSNSEHSRLHGALRKAGETLAL
jgi:hypothetical protein